MFNGKRPFSISILGSCGGVAKAVLAILNQSAEDKSDPLYPIISKSQLHLIDIKQKDKEYYDQLFPTSRIKLTFTSLISWK